MRYTLDTEFNGFGGDLLSLALVREDGESLYLVTSEPPPLVEWAADRLRAMVAIAPPPGTSDDDDRDDACQDVIDPEITRIVTLAEGAGWNRGEVTTAIFALAISDIRHAAGNAVAIEMLEQAIEAIKHSP